MRNKEKIILTQENKSAMCEAIKRYFLNERDEDLGDLAAGLILKFIVDELAPEFYNQGIYDAHRYINERAEDLLTLQI